MEHLGTDLKGATFSKASFWVCICMSVFWGIAKGRDVGYIHSCARKISERSMSIWWWIRLKVDNIGGAFPSPPKMARYFRVLKLLFIFTFNVCWALAYLSAYLSKIIASFFVESKDDISTKPWREGHVFWNGRPSRNSEHDYMYRVYVVEFQCFTSIETSNVKIWKLCPSGVNLWNSLYKFLTNSYVMVCKHHDSWFV